MPIRIRIAAIAPPTEVTTRIVAWTRTAIATAVSWSMPNGVMIAAAVSSNVPTKPGPDGTIVARATPVATSAPCASVSSMPTAWPPARNVVIDAPQASTLNPIAAASVRGRPATRRPSRSRRPSSTIRGHRSRNATTRSAPGSRWAAMPSPSPTTSSVTNASPSRTALLITPRALSTSTLTAAIDTTMTVSTIRSTTTVPRTVVRLMPSPSPRAWLRTSSPSRAGRMLLAR